MTAVSGKVKVAAAVINLPEAIERVSDVVIFNMFDIVMSELAVVVPLLLNVNP